MKRGSHFLTVLLCVAAFAVGFTWRFRSVLNADIETIKQSINYDEQLGMLNVLVLGLDDVESIHRTDTILLARVDIDHKTAAIMSIPRDTRVAIKGRGPDNKLNAVYAVGGIDLLRDTIANLTGVPVHYYVTINYASFPKIVDAVGGLDIVVEKSMVYHDRAQNLHINFPRGKRHMNGADGLKYVRFRHDALGDIGRMARQQAFAKAFLNKLATPAILPRIPELIQIVLSELDTDFPLKAAMQLSMQLKDMTPNRVRFFTTPGRAAYITKRNNQAESFFIPDLQAMSQMMDPNYGLATAQPKTATTQEGTDAQAPAKADSISYGQGGEGVAAKFNQPIAVLNGTGRTGLAKQFTTLFEKAGIEVAFTGNARHSDFHFSLVYYSDKGSPDLGRQLARLCGISEKLVRKSNIQYPVALVIGKNNSAEILTRLRRLLKEQ